MANDISSVDKFVALAKRQFGIGSTSDTGDRTTLDIVSYLNLEMLKIWQMRSWQWSLYDISRAFAASTSDLTFDGADANLGQIEILYLSGGTDYLIPMTFKEWVRWRKDENDTTGTPSRYVKKGRDSSGNLKIILVPTSSSSGTLKGEGKKRITKYSVSDIAAATAIAFFPDEVLQVIFDFVGVRILRSLGKTADASVLRQEAKDALGILISSDANQPDEEIQAPPPDIIRWKQRKRNSGLIA